MAPAEELHACLLCARKFPSSEALRRHEQLSELHRRNVTKQEELVLKRKQELLGSCAVLRQQLYSMDGQLNDRCLPEQEAFTLHKQRQVLEAQFRQLLGEYGQAQEVLEDGRSCRPTKSGALPGPTECDISLGQLRLEVGVSSWQGNKDVQEDRYISNIELDGPAGEMIVGICVLDGHSGSACVEMLVERFPLHLQDCISRCKTLSEAQLGQAVADACRLSDEEFLRGARQQHMNDGSTMILALVYPEEICSKAGDRSFYTTKQRLMVANVGDSRAVICSAAGVEDQLRTMRLSEDHKPSRPDERQRIESQGGIVDLQGVWRVFAPGPLSFGGRVVPIALAVSRAFGNLLLKEPETFGCGTVRPGGLVIAVPEIRVVDLELGHDRFLILACDGIWDVIGDEEATTVCSRAAGVALAALALNRHAYIAGSDDNLTSIVVAWSVADT